MFNPSYIVLSFEEYESILAELERLRQRRDPAMPDVDDITFLSPRLYGHLQRQGIKNVKDLEKTTRDQWISLRGFGKTSYRELQELMAMYGLRFKVE